MKQFYLLLASTVIVSSCNGQDNNPQQLVSGHSKLVKTQGTGKYANIHCSLQDKAGNLWFGTTGEGVYRYDGKSFTQFTTNDGLSGNTVWSVLEDRSGNIWFGTDNGASRFDGATITRVPVALSISSDLTLSSASGKNPYEKNEVWSMMQYKDGTILFGSRDGMYRYNGRSFSRFLDDKNIINSEGLNLKMVDCMIQDKAGNIWFASGMLPGSEGLIKYDGKSLTRYRPGGEGWIRYVVEDRRGGLWIGTRHNGVWRYDGKDFTRFMEGNDIGLAALVDNAGNVWFSGGEKSDGYSSDGNVWLYDGATLKNIAANSVGNYGVWTMLEDKAGNIWFGTRNTGLYRYDGKTFTSFSE
ncbi:ligand-binding sensor domain-containing protein [Polluticoccus soli]|uniref:ligand-binding sensor domain-containing protein n=1 Tax=Polluticoccus soli TaxID=3034150 RepID=UPI0023E34A43|nr:two-component regulator propeller domain-containing protein [Flavipsychrobacter sp. JY13-12]